jgi:8-oxo-dGTP diphosphatase
MSESNRHLFTFCPHCRTEMTSRPEGGIPRPVCPSCGFVQYLNPAPGAGVVLIREGRICLVQRKFAPKEGQWTLPTGFMEWDETIEETAVREVREETGLDVNLTRLYAVETGILPPDLPVLVVFFLAEETGGALRAGDDAAEAGFYAFDEFPGPIAFGAHRRVLARIRQELDSAS